MKDLFEKVSDITYPQLYEQQFGQPSAERGLVWDLRWDCWNYWDGSEGCSPLSTGFSYSVGMVLTINIVGAFQEGKIECCKTLNV